MLVDNLDVWQGVLPGSIYYYGRVALPVLMGNFKIRKITKMQLAKLAVQLDLTFHRTKSRVKDVPPAGTKIKIGNTPAKLAVMLVPTFHRTKSRVKFVPPAGTKIKIGNTPAKLIVILGRT